MNAIAVLLSTALAAPLILTSQAAGQAAPLDLTGRWRLNADLSDARPRPPEPGDDASPEAQPGRRPGGRTPGGGMPGGMSGGGGGRGGGRGGMGSGARSNPEDMAKMRDAMRFVMEAPDGMIVTRKDDELVFTADNGDITRLLVTGKKMKTMAGGVEHDVKAVYKDGSLLVESTFGPMKVVDTYRLATDGKQLERVTKIDGDRAPRGGGGTKPLRRVYERVQ